MYTRLRGEREVQIICKEYKGWDPFFNVSAAENFQLRCHHNQVFLPAVCKFRRQDSRGRVKSRWDSKIMLVKGKRVLIWSISFHSAVYRISIENSRIYDQVCLILYGIILCCQLKAKGLFCFCLFLSCLVLSVVVCLLLYCVVLSRLHLSCLVFLHCVVLSHVILYCIVPLSCLLLYFVASSYIMLSFVVMSCVGLCWVVLCCLSCLSSYCLCLIYFVLLCLVFSCVVVSFVVLG